MEKPITREKEGMTITVILCTFNRCERLKKALESVACSKLPGAIDWEVLVVDNNSSDATSAVVKHFCELYGDRFRYLFEPCPGKSYALNAGIRGARGSIVVFMDDDVTVEPTWLENLTSVLGCHQWTGVGGRVLPLWSMPPPKWLPNDPRALAPLAGFDLGATAGPLMEAPCGTNMAFRKSVFDKFGGFRTDLGPSPGRRNSQRGLGVGLPVAESWRTALVRAISCRVPSGYGKSPSQRVFSGLVV